jgi:hypothetical protein
MPPKYNRPASDAKSRASDPPPEHWCEKQRVDGLDDAAIKEKWMRMSSQQRHYERYRRAVGGRRKECTALPKGTFLPPPQWWIDEQHAAGLDDAAIKVLWEVGTKPAKRNYIRTMPATKKKSGVKPEAPPAEWIAVQRAVGFDDDDEIIRMWENEMTAMERQGARRRAGIAATATWAGKGKKCDAPHESWVADQRATGLDDDEIHEKWTRGMTSTQRNATKGVVSLRRIEFHAANTTGCSVDGCILAPGQQPPEMVLPCLFVHAKRNDAHSGCVCLRHLVKGRPRVHDERVVEPDEIELMSMKHTVGCQHPLHASMWYAPLIPAPGVNSTTMAATQSFIDVSHIRSGEAVLHCRFCHALWGLMEQLRLFNSPLYQAQFAQLIRVSPAFVQHFEQTTADFDWATERATYGARVSSGNKRRWEADRVRRAKKRRRELHPSSGDEPSSSESDSPSSGSSNDDVSSSESEQESE